MSLDIIAKPFLVTKGKGFVNFHDGFKKAVNFSINLLHNGKVRGELDFSTIHMELIGYILENKQFSFAGIDSDGNTISSKNCILSSIDGKDCNFYPFEVHFNHRVLKREPSQKLYFQFSLLNVYAPLSVRVKTDYGDMYLQQYQNYADIDRLMTEYKIPLITSLLTLPIQADGNKPIKEILAKVTGIVEAFIKVTSLSQTCWHDWAILEIFEITDKNEKKFLYRQSRRPKLKPPYLLQLTDRTYAQTFIESAWKGYSKDNIKYGFDYALEWFIEANSVETDVVRFILATTCLELLISKFKNLRLGKSKKDSSTDEKERQKLFRSVRKNIRTYLTQKHIPRDTISQICKLVATEKGSFEEKAFELLGYWGISIQDIQTSLKEIIDIRDKIVHRGLYFHDISPEKSFKVIEATNDLFHILVRIFLAMLSYDKQYYYSIENKWINFQDVCSKVGRPGFSN